MNQPPVTPPIQPPIHPEAIAFFDGQNVYRSVKRMFGCSHPNYDPLSLAQRVSLNQGWQLKETRFYTGVPIVTENYLWHHFWRAKFIQMRRDSVYVFSRDLRYQEEEVVLPDGQTHIVRVAREKGIDVRIAIDIMRLAHQRAYDVALIFSQDQDFSEVAMEIRAIAQEQNRWIRVACAFPCTSDPRNRGINNTQWIRINQQIYNLCIDPRDYRPRMP